MRQKGKIYFGTCSWKYDSWRELVYPAEGEFNFLEEYSRQFNSVEIDQWFWSLHGKGKVSLPRETDVMQYAGSVPETFRFSIKMPNSITLTHYYAKQGEPLHENPYFLSGELTGKFLTTLAPMYPVLGPLMFQFEYLNKKKMPSLQAFLARLEDFIPSLPTDKIFGIEIRNPNYLLPEYFEFLRARNLVPVFLQGYYMPAIFPLIRKYIEYIGNTAVIRLHGPDRKGIEAKSSNMWNRILEPKDDELRALIETLALLLDAKKEVYVNVNNHYEGSAPLTILKIKEMMRAEGLEQI